MHKDIREVKGEEESKKNINKHIEEGAIELANKTIDDVRNEKKRKVKEKEERMNKLIEEMAQALIEENKVMIGKSVAEEAIDKINGKKKTKEK